MCLGYDRAGALCEGENVKDEVMADDPPVQALLLLLQNLYDSVDLAPMFQQIAQCRVENIGIPFCRGTVRRPRRTVS